MCCEMVYTVSDSYNNEVAHDFRNAWDDASTTSTTDIKQTIANNAIHWLSLAATTTTIRRYILTVLLNMIMVLH